MLEARRKVQVPAPLLVVALLLGGAAQFLLAARGGYLLTAHFAPEELAQVPGQTLRQIHQRGLAAVVLAVLPFVAAALAFLGHRLTTAAWPGSVRRAALWMAGVDGLVLIVALLTSS